MADVEPGDTFVFDPDGGTNRHLWIVLAVYEVAHSYEPHAAIVSVTSWRKRADESCILRSTDADRHPFVFHASYADYSRMLERPVSSLRVKEHVPANGPLLGRLRKGFHKSPFARRGFKDKIPRE